MQDQKEPTGLQTRIANFSLQDLRELERLVPREIVRREAAERQQVREAVKAMIEASGLALEDVLGARTRAPRGEGRSRQAQPPKYFNPRNPEQTWSGRGRKPDWILSIEAAGGSLDACLISN